MSKKKQVINEMPGKKVWWQTKVARMAGYVSGAFFTGGFIVWLIFFMPYVRTDDAKIDADIIKAGNLGMSAQVIKIYVKNGDRVEKGSILAELDHSTAEATLDKAKAAADFASAKLKRALSAVKYQGISMDELNRLQQADSMAKADLKLAEIALERTYIKSPSGGTVIQVNAVEGNILEMNQVAFMIADVDNAWVTANIQEKKVGKIKAGQVVYINIDEGGKVKGVVADVRRAAGSVFSLIPTDNASGNFTKVEQRIPVKIDITSNNGHSLRIGQSVEIKIRIR